VATGVTSTPKVIQCNATAATNAATNTNAAMMAMRFRFIPSSCHGLIRRHSPPSRLPEVAHRPLAGLPAQDSGPTSLIGGPDPAGRFLTLRHNTGNLRKR
jgi:hypothetical protein